MIRLPGLAESCALIKGASGPDAAFALMMSLPALFNIGLPALPGHVHLCHLWNVQSRLAAEGGWTE